MSLISSLCLYCNDVRSDLHSFPTRRSSDLPNLGVVSLSLAPGVTAAHSTNRGDSFTTPNVVAAFIPGDDIGGGEAVSAVGDRKSTRLNSSHLGISYAVFCLKKKKKALTINM